MISLAKDIVTQGAVFDAPLVVRKGENYIVHDGNRRVTCLKAICGICSVPDNLQRQFLELKKDFDCSEDMKISCQLEKDQAIVDQIVSRRHNGTDGGRGQLGWDTRAKQNHAKRIGTATQYPIAEAIEDFLEKCGYPFSHKIKRSTLFRLVAAKRRQRRIGIYLKEDGSLALSRERGDVRNALIKIADDIVDGQLTLKNVLNSQGIDEYMSDLQEAGYLVDTKQGNESRDNNDANDANPQNQNQNIKRKPERLSLIPKKDYDIDWPHGLHKAEKLWEELQYSLNFRRHEISIPIAFRVLIELLTNYANRRTASPRRENDKLASRVKHVAHEFFSQNLLSNREYEDLCRLLGKSGSTRELEVLHRCIHSKTVMPSNCDLIALWTALEHYLLLCITISRK